MYGAFWNIFGKEFSFLKWQISCAIDTKRVEPSWRRTESKFSFLSFIQCRLRLKCDSTHTETRFRLSAKRTSPFKLAGASVQSTTGSRGVRISGINAGYTMFRGSVKSTGYPLHSPVSPSLPLPCVTVCRHISTGLYRRVSFFIFRVTETCNMKMSRVTPSETLALNQTIRLHSPLNIIVSCILSFGRFPGIWISCAGVSDHSFTSS
jgi:hypothetical protein